MPTVLSPDAFPPALFPDPATRQMELEAARLAPSLKALRVRFS